jgi:hypothetical protein
VHHADAFALHYSVPDEISFPGVSLSWGTFKDPLIAGGSYGDVRVTKMVRRAVLEDATSVATEEDIRGGMLLSGLDFEVGESVGANTPPVPTG